MVRIEDVSELRGMLEQAVADEERDIPFIQNLIARAERAGAMGTATVLRNLLPQENKKRDTLKRLADKFAKEEQRLLLFPEMALISEANAGVSESVGRMAGYAGVREPIGRMRYGVVREPIGRMRY